MQKSAKLLHVYTADRGPKPSRAAGGQAMKKLTQILAVLAWPDAIVLQSGAEFRAFANASQTTVHSGYGPPTPFNQIAIQMPFKVKKVKPRWYWGWPCITWAIEGVEQ